MGNAFLSLGVRKFESTGRKKYRDELEIAPKTQNGRSVIMPFDNHEKRREFEMCTLDHQHRVNPIARWTDTELWAYIHDAKLEQCSLYRENFTRLGCIGCPMARKKAGSRNSAVGKTNKRSGGAFEPTCGFVKRNVRRDFGGQAFSWPKFKEQYIRTLGRMLEDRKAAGMKILDFAATAQDWFDWWISDKAQDTEDENQLTLWGYDVD